MIPKPPKPPEEEPPLPGPTGPMPTGPIPIPTDSSETCTGPTGITGAETSEAQPMKPDLLAAIEAHAHAKVSMRDDDESTTSGRLLPNVMKRLDEMRRGWNTN